jgi:hypothetical protein
MKKLTVLLTILVVALSLTSCQTNPKFQAYNDQVDEEQSMAMKVPGYFWDRFLDLTDIVTFDLGFGDGFLFNAHATKWLQLGVGYRDGVCFGVLPRSFGMWYENRKEGGLALAPFVGLYFKNLQREALWGTTTLFEHDVLYQGVDHMSNDTSHWSAIGVNLHLFLVGVDAGISPYEIFDFIFGWFGMPFLVPVDPVGFGSEVDTANDDLRARKVRNDSDMPYYDFLLDPHPSATANPAAGGCEKCKAAGKECGCNK